MKTLFVVALTSLASATAYAGGGEIIAGGGLAFGTDIATPGLQLNGYYGFDSNSALANLRVGGDFDIFLPNSDTQAEGKLTTRWADLNLNAQYVFVAPKDQPFLFYGLAGLNFAFLGAKFEYDSALNQRDYSNSTFKAGVNVGVGGEYAIDVGEKNGADFSIYGEGKYVISDADQLVFAAGVRVALPL